MRNVNELNQDELKELRTNLFYKLLDDGSLDEMCGNIESHEEIPMSFVKDHYREILFSEDDFFCNVNKIELPKGIFRAKLNSFQIELSDGTKINVEREFEILVKNVSNFSFKLLSS